MDARLSSKNSERKRQGWLINKTDGQREEKKKRMNDWLVGWPDE